MITDAFSPMPYFSEYLYIIIKICAVLVYIYIKNVRLHICLFFDLKCL